MTKRLASLLLPLATAGCAALGHPAASQVEAKHVAGYYYQGDGLGTNILVQLREDGTYSSTWHGCLGEYGSSSGTWLVEAGSVKFEPTAETEMLVGYLLRAKVRSSWPNYKLVPELGSADPDEVLHPYFPDSR